MIITFIFSALNKFYNPVYIIPALKQRIHHNMKQRAATDLYV